MFPRLSLSSGRSSPVVSSSLLESYSLCSGFWLSTVRLDRVRGAGVFGVCFCDCVDRHRVCRGSVGGKDDLKGNTVYDVFHFVSHVHFNVINDLNVVRRRWLAFVCVHYSTEVDTGRFLVKTNFLANLNQKLSYLFRLSFPHERIQVLDSISSKLRQTYLLIISRQ